MELDDISTAEQVADYLKLPVEKIKRLACNRQLAHIRAGRSFLFTRDSIRSWVERNTVEVPPAPQIPYGLTERSYRRLRDHSGRLDK
jgi:excisionase family DNA binding protein